MKFYNTYKTATLIILSLVFLSSCSKEPVTETFENSLVNVKFLSTDSDLSKLNIDVLDVQFRVLEDETNPNAWIRLNTINTGVQEISCLNQNKVLNLVDFEELTSGFIYDIKINYGDQNTATKDGVEYTLNVDADFQNASRNIIEKELEANTIYDFIVEFEIDKSVKFSSDGSVNFKPKMNTVMRRLQVR